MNSAIIEWEQILIWSWNEKVTILIDRLVKAVKEAPLQEIWFDWIWGYSYVIVKEHFRQKSASTDSTMQNTYNKGVDAYYKKYPEHLILRKR
jgi:hypothetical protein